MTHRRRIVVATLLLLAAVAVAVWWARRDSGPLPNRLTLVDVSTGEIRSFRRGSDALRVIPAPTGPEGERLLYPVVREDGAWAISGRYRQILVEQQGARPDLAIDLQTFKIRAD